MPVEITIYLSAEAFSDSNKIIARVAFCFRSTCDFKTSVLVYYKEIWIFSIC